MFATVRRGETRQTFNIWVYGDAELLRGSGIYVSESGVVCNHHFLLPADGTNFTFLAGDYDCDLYASVVGANKVLHLSSTKLTVPDALEPQLKNLSCGVYFDWGPDSQKYHARSDKNVEAPS